MTVKKSWVKSVVFAAVPFSGVMLSAGIASAAEYVCYVQFQSGNSVYGSEGNLHFATYTGPSCTGTFIRQYFYCTAGATNTGCASSALYRHDRQSILAVYGVLQRAAAADQQTVVSAATCIGGGNTCAGVMTVRSD
jgi:hypothetical protein